MKDFRATKISLSLGVFREGSRVLGEGLEVVNWDEVSVGATTVACNKQIFEMVKDVILDVGFPNNRVPDFILKLNNFVSPFFY